MKERLNDELVSRNIYKKKCLVHFNIFYSRFLLFNVFFLALFSSQVASYLYIRCFVLCCFFLLSVLQSSCQCFSFHFIYIENTHIDSSLSILTYFFPPPLQLQSFNTYVNSEIVIFNITNKYINSLFAFKH